MTQHQGMTHHFYTTLCLLPWKQQWRIHAHKGRYMRGMRHYCNTKHLHTVECCNLPLTNPKPPPPPAPHTHNLLTWMRRIGQEPFKGPA